MKLENNASLKLNKKQLHFKLNFVKITSGKKKCSDVFGLQCDALSCDTNLVH